MAAKGRMVIFAGQLVIVYILKREEEKRNQAEENAIANFGGGGNA